MLLTITSTTLPATDLGYLLHKNPARVQSFDLPFGKAHVFYPEAGAELCTAALMLDVDSIHLVRRHRGPADQYVSDRAYVASSFMSVAMGRVYGTAMTGESRERPELAVAAIPLTVGISVIQCAGGEEILRRLFEPLGYAVKSKRHTLDEQHPEWGMSPYFTVELAATKRLSELLTHLYVLIPVLDAEKHYWVGDDEVEKLLRKGEGWLAAHPERELISRRYLKRGHLVRAALAQLAETDEPDPDSADEIQAAEEEEVEQRISLNDQRLGAVLSVIKGCGATRVLDLGCGEGRLLKALMGVREISEIVGMDVSCGALGKAEQRLKLEGLPTRQRERIKLIQGALTYRDNRLKGYDAAAVVEVIEHLDPPRLASFERVLFEHARPGLVVVTTPNAEYNVRFPTLAAGSFRHRDHRFEWSRGEFREWAARVAERFCYEVRFLPVGPEDAEVGSPTQMGVFVRCES